MTGDTPDDKSSPHVHDRAMLRLIPGPLHRLALRLAHGLRLFWWRRTGKIVRGCNVIAVNADGHILLVRHSYHLEGVWMVPGGGIAAGESPVEGARRELSEEVGCTLRHATHFDTLTLDWGRWTNVIELVTGTTCDMPRADGREIAEARFFDPDALPDATGAAAQAMIKCWLRFQKGSSA